MLRYLAFLSVGILWGAEAKLYLQLGHPVGITSVALSPDGRLALTGGKDGTARLWETASGLELRSFQIASGLASAALVVAFSPDGRLVVTGNSSDTARLWDASTGTELRRFGGNLLVGDTVLGSVYSVAFFSDGRFLLSGDGVGAVHLWNVATGAEVKVFRGHAHPVTSVSFSPDGRSVLAGSTEDQTAFLWDTETGAELRRFESPYWAIGSVAFSPDGRFVLTGGHDPRLWDATSGAELRHFSVPGQAGDATFSPDGRSVLIGGSRPGIWDASNGSALRSFVGDSRGDAASVAFSRDGRFVLTGGEDKVARLWDAATGAEVRRFQGDSAMVNTVAFSPDGRIIAIGGEDKTAHLWDTAIGAEARRLQGHSYGVTSVAFSRDGHFVLTGSRDWTARLWDSTTWSELRRFSGLFGALSPDGRFVMVNRGNETWIHDAATGADLRKLPTGGAGSVPTFSPDGRFVLAGNREWDAMSGAELNRFNDGTPFSISPNSRFVLTSRGLWDTTTGTEFWRFKTDSLGGFTSGIFSPDGHFILTGGNDRTAHLWNADTGAEIQRLQGHSLAVSAVAFSPDGLFVLTGSFDGTSRLWNRSTGKWLASLVSFPAGGWAVVDPDGRFDTSDLDGGAALHWVLDSDPMRALPLEIFMRDYYTPRLLARILSGEKLPPVAAIGDIKNRVQPQVDIVTIAPPPGSANRVNVSVRAVSKTENNQASGLQDLRLFRNGQMVGYREGPLQGGSYEFQNIQLPLSQRRVAFTAYAFNSARIKSATVQRDFEYRPQGELKPRAYLVQIGVNHYQASGCELHYAVNDAQKLHTALESRLAARGLEVHAQELISPGDNTAASRISIRQALADIASKATPDDVLFLSFSGHGYTASNGQFYILPSDIRGACSKPDVQMLKNAISADDLTEWLRPIDAGEMVFVLDACYSAASVEANDFKPGPMGSRGLGQLAYDKRMRILAASQSDEQAQEDSRFGQGLLSYALAEEGLVERKADWKPKDQQITIGEWLAYAADAVPKLSTAKTNDVTRGFLIEVVRRAQIPAVFDFTKQDQFVIQK